MAEVPRRGKTPEEISRAQFKKYGCDTIASRLNLYQKGEQTTAHDYLWQSVLERNGGTLNTIADIGSGDAMEFIHLVEKHRYKGEMYPIDIHPKVFKHNAEYARKKGYSNIHFTVGDATNLRELPFGQSVRFIPDSMSDETICTNVLNLLDDEEKRRKAINEQVRITKDQGRVQNGTRGPDNLVEFLQAWKQWGERHGIVVQDVVYVFGPDIAYPTICSVMPDTRLAHEQKEKIRVSEPDDIADVLDTLFRMQDIAEASPEFLHAMRRDVAKPFLDQLESDGYIEYTVHEVVYESIVYK